MKKKTAWSKPGHETKKPKTEYTNCYRVRVVSGGLIHILSETEPVVTLAPGNGAIESVAWKPIEDTSHGDTIGFIRWSDVTAISWRAVSLNLEAESE